MTDKMVNMMKKCDLRGSRLWILYKNVCNQNINETIDVLKLLVSSENPEDVIYVIRKNKITVLEFIEKTLKGL